MSRAWSRCQNLAAASEALHAVPALSTSTTSPSSAQATLCALEDLSVRYGARLANDGVSLHIKPGEVVALLGENGAGKTTLLHALYGLLPISAGRVYYGGQPVVPSPERAIAQGIGLVSQHFLLIPRLTVAENITLGREPRRRLLGGLLELYDKKRAEAEVAELGQRYGLSVEPTRRVSELGVGEAQRVEILKTLYRGARCLLLDEPTALLTPKEARHMLGVLRKLIAEVFVQPGSQSPPVRPGLLIVTHKLDEVMEIADRAVVMRAGRVVAEYRRAEFSPREMAHALVGRELVAVTRSGAAANSAPPAAADAQAALAVRDLRVVEEGSERVRGISFELAPGSILGIGGVEGNGQSALCAALAGLVAPAAGQILFFGRDVTALRVRARRDLGLSFILEDRQRHGLVLDFSLAENLLLSLPARYFYGPSLLGLIAHRRLRKDAEKLLRLYDVRPPEPNLPARALSGGNQQKLLLARALGLPERLPRVLIAAQPTRGVDIGAVESIHRELLSARDRGCAILLVSADLDELRVLCDRIAVLYRGKLVANLENPADAPISRERLGELLSGVG